MITKAQAEEIKVGDSIVVSGREVVVERVFKFDPAVKFPPRDSFMNDPKVWPMFNTTYYRGTVGWECVEEVVV